jgi:hypothetical protein
MKVKKDRVIEAPRYPILEGIKSGLENMVSGQYENWNRFWSRLGSDEYTFGMLTADMVRFWGTWAGGAADLVVAPIRGASGNAVPTLIFFLDHKGSAKVFQELSVPPSYKFMSGRKPDYFFAAGGTVPEAIWKQLSLDFKPNRAERRFKVTLSPSTADLKKWLKQQEKPWPSKTDASAVIFQGRAPIAFVQVVFA